MKEKPWQLQLFAKSLKKKEKLRILNKNLNIPPSSLILDLGCAQGVLSYFLRQKGGTWISADQDFQNLQSSYLLLKNNLIQVEEGPLPFMDESFDRVVSLDYLEHLEKDDQCLEEIKRILKPGGQLVLATPRTGRFFFIHKLRSLLGMKLEYYGHKREGYRKKDLKTKVNRAGMSVNRCLTFSRTVTEFLELVLNFLYIRFSRLKTHPKLRDGHIRPSTGKEFSSEKKSFRIYSFIYPLIWLLSRVDKLLFWQRGYVLLIWAKK
ncbi:class I SAM-dependent methyltransferase [bacterium]|nr:class I SAM-dependent methyltransferase [bacterium]